MTTDPSQQRKDDTRRKILAGAAVLNHAAKDEAFAAELAALLNRFVLKPQERALFDFLPDRTTD
jgi:hypothetical protein